MTAKLHKAIRNNNGLYEAVFSSRRIKFSRTDSLWYSTQETPPLYSNIVTLSPDWRPDAVFSAVDANYERDGWQEWSLKDSFGVLDLNAHGFKKLFDAQWIYLEADAFDASAPDGELRFEIVTREDGLAAWRRAWDADERLGREIFDAKLLDDQNVCFVAGYDEEQIACGCLINKTDDVLGVSNLFPHDGDVSYWSGMIDFVRASHGALDIVAYERCARAESLRALGFEPVGKLAVWLKKRESGLLRDGSHRR